MFSGCVELQLTPEGKAWLRKALHAVGLEIAARPKPSATPSPLAEATTGDGLQSPEARKAKANAELLHEMYHVVFLLEPRDRAAFGSYVDTLNQGASLEGVYNGFTHSSDYRTLEMSGQGASAQALRVFCEELALLEAELAAPTEFTAQSAQPLALPVAPGLDPGGEVVEFPGKQSQPSPGARGVAAPSPIPSFNPKTMADQYGKLFVGASIYTLKRVLGDEAMKVVGEKLEYRQKLADWYSRWVVRMAGRQVDFGLALRNKPDPAFHYQWAVQSSEDRIRWEVLNRLHRVLNEANRLKQ